MAIAESVVDILLQKLADSLIREATFLHGVGDQVQWLEAEFRRMQCFLEDADAKQEGDERVKGWVEDVRVLAYDVEDVIDTVLFKVATLRRRRTGFVGCIKRYACIFNELKARHQVGSKIKQIKAKIREISERRSTYGIENIGQGVRQETDFVGFEKELEMLVARLTEGELRRCVVSVVGMGGLGKTTLTKKLYNADTVKKHFHIHAWISVSQEYSPRDLLQTITKRCMVLSKEQLELVEEMDVIELRDNISKYLNDKRYLVVLDDIWKREAWDALKDAFPDVNNGSRVVLTTRNKEVALYADPRSQPHELRFLTNEESWDLFCKKTFLGRDGGCLQDLEKLGRVIVEKCHGVPLAIAIIGGLLSRKEPREWENVHKSISWQFVEGEVQISSILSLSYNYLPDYLQPCFLYLANFPEDYEFKAKELIRLWAAEGFLKERGELTLEEVGEDSLNELVQRSLVQVVGRSSSSGIKSYRIHPFSRYLYVLKAQKGQFMDVHDGNANARPCTSRRLAIHLNDSSECNFEFLSSFAPNLNSVLIYTQGHEWLPREQEKLLYTGFKLLKVLHLHGSQIKELPSEIGRLILLRYLRCTKTLLKSLPSSMVNLLNLQTLHVTSRSEIKLPGAIIQMEQLRHFQVKGVFDSNYFDWSGRCGMIEGHPRLGQISSNLQILSYVKSGKWMEGCLRKLTNLKKLGICLVTQADANVFYESIANMDHLESLSVVIPADVSNTVGLLASPLSHLRIRKLRLEAKIEKLPESYEFPINLTMLSLAYSHLNQDSLATLEKLVNLNILRLLGYSYVGVKMVFSAEGFRRLESLHLQGLYDLEEWEVEKGAMPSLSHLQIRACLNLKKVPEGLQYVNTLQKLVFQFMPDDFQERLREGGEDWYKIRHIPYLDRYGVLN